MTWWKQNTHCLIFYDAINHLLIYNRLSIDYNDCRHSGKAASVLMWFRAMQFFQCCFQECNRVVPLHRRNTLVTVPLRPFSISVRPHNVQREKGTWLHQWSLISFVAYTVTPNNGWVSGARLTQKNKQIKNTS